MNITCKFKVIQDILYEKCHLFNSSWHSDDIWWYSSRSTLAQVMAFCLTALSHHLNQCLLIRDIQWHSPEGNFTRNTSSINHWNWIENYSLKSPSAQWAKQCIVMNVQILEIQYIPRIMHILYTLLHFMAALYNQTYLPYQKVNSLALRQILASLILWLLLKQ